MIWLAVLFALVALPAEAGPIAAVATTVFTWVGSTLAAGGIGAAVLRFAGGLALSALSQKLRGKPKRRDDNSLRFTYTTEGGVRSRTSIVGECAVKGHSSDPAMTGSLDDDPNEYLVLVLSLADHPIDGLSSIILNGDQFVPDTPILSGEMAGWGLGPPEGHPMHGYFAMRLHDGTQTAADQWLVDHFGDYPERPWSSDMIGYGVPYVVLILRANQEIYAGTLEWDFILRGARLYDPRKDGTVGGVGPQRWGDKSTWGFSRNPMVQAYNIGRGFELYPGRVYGCKKSAEEMPLAEWVAAMNVCDEMIDGRHRYEAALEFEVSEDPLDVMEDLGAACNASFCQMAGRIHVQVGPPPPSILTLGEGEFLASEAREYEPFPGMAETYNGISATFIRPGQNWKAGETIPFIRQDWLAEDGELRMFELPLPAVTYWKQARRLQREALTDHRRMRMVSEAWHPHYWEYGVKPLRTVTLNRSRHGFVNKLVEIEGLSLDPRTLALSATLRERDPSDYDIDPSDNIPPADPSPVPVSPILGVYGWQVGPWTGNDASGDARLAGFRMSWSPDTPCQLLRWEARVKATGEPHGSGVVDVANGRKVVVGLPVTAYQVRTRPIAGRQTVWTPWTDVLTPDVRIGQKDLDPGLNVILSVTSGTRPATGSYIGQIVFETDTNLLYKWSGSGWVALNPDPQPEIDQAVFDAIDGLLLQNIDGQLVPDQFAARSILAQKLVLTNFFNLVENPGFEAGSIGWTIPASAIVVADTASARTGDRYLRFDGSSLSGAYAEAANANVFDVEGGQHYRLWTWARMSGGAVTGTVGAKIRWKLTNGTFTETLATKVNPGIAYTRVSAMMEAPIGAVSGQVVVFVNNVATGFVRVDDCFCALAADADLHVDGSITAPKINVESLSAITTVVGNITIGEANIGTAAVTRSKVGGKEVVSSESASFGTVAMPTTLAYATLIEWDISPAPYVSLLRADWSIGYKMTGTGVLEFDLNFFDTLASPGEKLENRTVEMPFSSVLADHFGRHATGFIDEGYPSNEQVAKNWAVRSVPANTTSRLRLVGRRDASLTQGEIWFAKFQVFRWYL
jgi:hypothetical protein